ncbi:MAG: hypothetical protein MUE60_14260 [Candidatus Eisenbacteria bacterium]|jgi:hypothetical protein|nr:hypothetical protein [Candidatus Eisenbacteria bacterium]
MIAHREKTSLPRAVMACGMAYSLLALSLIRGEVFFNGDAGLKALMAKQWARGERSVELKLEAPLWIRQLWDEGCYPFQPPFVYADQGRRFISFPLLFPALSGPFYRAAGFRGLYLIPTLSLWITWAVVDRVARRRGASPRERAWKLTLLVFGSPLTLYGAMFWEHTLAVAVVTIALSLAVPRPGESPTTTRMAGAGMLLGVGAWIRPEILALAAGAAIPVTHALRERPATARAFVLGMLLSAGVYVGANTAVSGHPFGYHGMQVTHGFSNVRHIAAIPRLLIKLPVLFVLFFPPLLAMIPRPSVLGRHRRDRQEMWVVVGIVAGMTALASMIPNDGGKQWGPRYLLALLPGLVIASPGTPFGREGWPGRGRRVAMMVCLAAGVVVNTGVGMRRLAWDYHSRVLPALEYLTPDRSEVIAVSHQFVAQELEALFDSRTMVLIDGVDAFHRLARAVDEQGISHFTYVCLANRVMPDDMPVETARGPRTIVAEPPVHRGWFLIYHAALVAGVPRMP